MATESDIFLGDQIRQFGAGENVTEFGVQNHLFIEASHFVSTSVLRAQPT
jgi:hypothetical protein